MSWASAAAASGDPSAVAEAAPQQSTSPTPAARARATLAAMSLDDKIAMVHGTSTPYVGEASGWNASLGIPAIRLQDGRQGCVGSVATDNCPRPLHRPAS